MSCDHRFSCDPNACKGTQNDLRPAMMASAGRWPVSLPTLDMNQFSGGGLSPFHQPTYIQHRPRNYHLFSEIATISTWSLYISSEIIQQSVIDPLSCVRVWQWSTAQSGLVARHCNTSDTSNQDNSDTKHMSEVLDQIWRKRREKAREKRWHKVVTWV
jgi:hypothetical protein